MEQKNVIVDCDAGIDDALALILLLNAHKTKKIKILAVTCVYGNTTVNNVARNVCRTMNTCEVTEIPVYMGAYSPLLSTANVSEAAIEQYHGEDGFADVFNQEPDMSLLRYTHAVYALNKITMENSGEVSMICMGPLTNIALTIRLYPDFMGNVKDFYVMGGNSTAQGNITSQAEFNFYTDPESAHILLNSIYKPLWLLPWECCLNSRVSHEWRKNVLGKVNSPSIHMMNKLENSRDSKKKQFQYYISCDAFLAAIFLRPDMAKNVVPWHVDIELEGKRTRGQVVLDHLCVNKTNVHLIEDFDSEIFKKLLFIAVNSSPDVS